MIALAPLLAIVGGDPGEVEPDAFLQEAVLAFLQAVHANPRTWRLVLMPPRGRSPELRARIAATRQLIAGRVAELLGWGIDRRGGPFDLELFARVIVATGEDAARLTLLHPRRYPPQRLAGMARDGVSMLPPTAPPRGADPLRGARRRASTLAARARGGAERTHAARRAPRAPPRRRARAHRRGWLDALSVEAVARRAGINRAIVYRSFANLQLLLLALLRREDARTRSMLEGLLPADAHGRAVPDLLAETLAAFLDAVVRHPRTYRVVLQRPESSPLILRKLINRRRTDLANRLRPLVEWGMAGVAAPTPECDVDVLCRLLLSSGEELGRLALDDPDYPPRRILTSTWTLLDLIPLR